MSTTQAPAPVSAMKAMADGLTGRQRPLPPAAGESAAAQALRAVEILRASGDASVQRVASALERAVLERINVNRELGLTLRRGGARDKPHARARRRMLEVELAVLVKYLGEKPTPAARTILQMMAAGHERTLMLRTMGNVPRSVEGVARVIRAAVKK